jgi:prefoldin subunit 5
MRLPFSGRYEKLETMNRILTDAARKRAERIEELERRVAQLERELEQVAQLKRELETAREALETAREAMERTKLLEVVAAERALLLNEKDKQLAEVREAATKYYFRIQELERSLAEIGQK